MKKKNPATKTHMVRGRISKEQREKLNYLFDETGVTDSMFIRWSIDKIKVKP